MLQESLFFFEQTDFSLRFARCTISETSLLVEELKEVQLGDASGLAQLAPAGTSVVCALRPKPRQLHLASAEEAKRYSGLAGLQQFAQSSIFAKSEPAFFAGVQASDGMVPSDSVWLMSLSSTTAQEQARKVFETINLKPARCLDATLATCGAVSSVVTGPTLLLEIGEIGSYALLIGNQGVVAARAVNLNLDQISEAVQTELGLKFRGSAAKLFFNPECDFSESGSKIAARLAVALKTDLLPLLAGQTAPTTLCCAGLPAMQSWLEIQLAAALGLTPHSPDIKAWSTTMGMAFSSSALASSVSPAWFGFLHFINSQTLESTGAAPWQAEWLSVKIPIASEVAKAVTAPPTPTVAPKPPAPVAAKAAPIATPKTPAPVPNKPTVSPAKPAPVAAPAAAVTVAKPAAPTAPAKAAVSSVQYSSKSTAQAATVPEPKKSGNKKPLFIGVVIVVLALLVGGYFYLDGQKEAANQLALEKQKTEQRIKAEQERAHLAEQKARQEAEDRKKFELETSQKLAAAEAARQQAEAEARAQTASRLANARGTLIVTTQPAGATVTVGDLPAKTSPATFDFIKIGKYPVTIALAHHEETKLELEVTENNTTESGVIQLPSLVGSVTLTSEPAGSSFELRPLNSFSITSDTKRTGQTPATVADLEPGDYSVTFSRAGWAPHTETISVARNATATSTWTFPSGMVKITSVPTGATVSQEGRVLGVTPITAHQAPGKGQYEFKLTNHDPVTMSVVAEEGKTVELSAQLPLTDIIYGPGDLERPPEPINPKLPELPSSLTLIEGRVVIQMTINRDGTTADLKLVRASNPEIGKIYMAAVAKWKFKPGIKDGKPVRSGVVAPFLIQPSKD